MPRRYLGFLALNVIVTVVVGFVLLTVYNQIAPPPTPPRVPPLQVIITATPDPNITPAVTVIVITATPGAATLVPLSGGTATVNPVLVGTIQTLDPTFLPTLPPQSTNEPEATATDASGCPIYTVKKGDTPGGIATENGVSLANLYKANGFTRDPILQIGQKLIIPANGCGLLTDTPTFTPTKDFTPTPIPTSTAIPTTNKTVIQIQSVVKPGDITEEGVNLMNVSEGVVEMTGWILANGTTEVFKFPTFRLFPNGKVLINTRAGQNSPIVLYAGKTSAQWSSGQTVNLIDTNGVIQATFNIP
jgi:LysM repeat protein